jgi:hypothetical protein
MIRQEKRRLTREYQKEMDKLVRVSDEIYKKNVENRQKVLPNLDALDKGICEDKNLQRYYDVMRNLSGRVVWLQNEISKINDKTE